VLSKILTNSAVVEVGGEWIRTDQIGVSSLAATLGLELVPIGVDLDQGFELLGALEGYLADEATDGWSALIVWHNDVLVV
jgi:hypothetical protein